MVGTLQRRDRKVSVDDSYTLYYRRTAFKNVGGYKLSLRTVLLSQMHLLELILTHTCA